jgi:hypothetical protein
MKATSGNYSNTVHINTFDFLDTYFNITFPTTPRSPKLLSYEISLQIKHIKKSLTKSYMYRCFRSVTVVSMHRMTLSICIQTGSRSHPASYPLCARGPFPGAGARCCWHQQWRATPPLHPNTFMACTRDSFSFTLWFNYLSVVTSKYNEWTPCYELSSQYSVI